jgi:hypothetical protein
MAGDVWGILYKYISVSPERAKLMLRGMALVLSARGSVAGIGSPWLFFLLTGGG